MQDHSSSSPLPPAAPESVEMFLAHLDLEKGYSRATVEAYALDVMQFEESLSRSNLSLAAPQNIGRRQIQAWLADLHRQKTGKSSMGRKLSALRSFFRFCARMRMISVLPTEGLSNPKTEKRHPKLLNVDQAFALLDVKKKKAAPGRAALCGGRGGGAGAGGGGG
ncbi:MAG: site-specific integrase, partial [Desulfovibrio sp.]|nr:site-specific integrase [Desulfovibrio sp.]